MRKIRLRTLLKDWMMNQKKTAKAITKADKKLKNDKRRKENKGFEDILCFFCIEIFVQVDHKSDLKLDLM